MRHIQARASDEQYKVIRKKAIDLGVDLETFMIQAAMEKAQEGERPNTKTKRKEGKGTTVT